MKTTLTRSSVEAAEHIRRGELAAFPTETVYGLGADAFNVEAVREVYRVKGRPIDNPMILHLADPSETRGVVTNVRPYAREMIATFFPGPLTLVFDKDPSVPMEVTAGLSTVGVRVPSHPLAREFLRACGAPVAAPSANRSGRPSPTTWQSVLEDLGGLIPCILQADRSTVGLESTVVDCTDSIPVILREGAVSLERLRALVPSVQPSSAAQGREARSPGLRHRHYAPRARVALYEGGMDIPKSSAYIGLTGPGDISRFDRVLICRDAEHYAHELFHFFRECDRAHVERIYCERPPARGIGRALLDRILRAAEEASSP